MMWLRIAVCVGIMSLSWIVIVSGLAQTKPADDAVSQLNTAAKTKVSWNFAKAKTADVTCDGKPDRIVFGVTAKKVWIGVVPGGGRAQAGSFPIQATNQASFCGVPSAIYIDALNCSPEAMGDLEGCKPVRGCKEFTVEGGECDNFHFYWNSRARRLDYWRL